MLSIRLDDVIIYVGDELLVIVYVLKVFHISGCIISIDAVLLIRFIHVELILDGPYLVLHYAEEPFLLLVHLTLERINFRTMGSCPNYRLDQQIDGLKCEDNL